MAAVSMASWSLRAPGPAVVVPAFVDCTGALHGDWARFRELFRTTPRLEEEGEMEEDIAPATAGPGLPTWEPELGEEAFRLHGKWKDKLAKYNEDYPLGASDFYHSCHFDEESSYCLYGHVAALTYLARYVVGGARYELTRAALRLLSWNHCLDYLESSSWGFSVLDLWDKAQGYLYPQVSLLHQHLFIGEGFGGAGPSSALSEIEPAAGDAPPNFWIFELGIHKALSNEPISMLRKVLPGHHILHQNFVKSYEGRAEAFRHPFPRECSPNCRHQQESVPYTFPVFEDMAESSRGFQEFLISTELSKPSVRRASLFLCSNPIYYCTFFAGLNRTTVGYFGLPLLYMVPKDDWDRWVRHFVTMAASPHSVFFANNPLLAEQLAWQSGVRVRVLQPLALYLEDSYYPTRINDVLVPEPREACVLNCLLRKFTPQGYPFKFFEKADTDRTLKTFASFRSIVIFPHDYALMSFYEFYAMSIPLFLPSHLSKYLFPYSATVPLLDWVPSWLEGSADRPPSSPLSMVTVAGLKYWSRYMDFFRFPAVQHFPSIAGLLEMLPAADLHGISTQMREYRLHRLIEATAIWESVAETALAPLEE